MDTASNAALIAPGLPMANVPTGTPPGICTMDRSESSPLSDGDSIGTPSTGKVVFAAQTPGKCAAPPAAAMRTSNRRSVALERYSNNASGARCAEIACASQGTLSSSNCAAQCCMISQSDLLPIKMPTKGLVLVDAINLPEPVLPAGKDQVEVQEFNWNISRRNHKTWSQQPQSSRRQSTR